MRLLANRKLIITLMAVCALLFLIKWYVSRRLENSIYVTNPSIEGNSAYLTIHNNFIYGNIVKVDLFNNVKIMDGKSIGLWPSQCYIGKGDSCRVRFEFVFSPESFVNQDIAVRLSNGKVHRYKLNHKNIFRIPGEIEIEDDGFCFLGEAEGRPENFDMCPEPVTVDNIYRLYRKYKVSHLDSTDLYLVEPKKLYWTSRHFNRLIKIQNGRQVAARTYYGWNILYAFTQGDKYFLGLNSLVTTAGYKNNSSFTCKTVLLDSLLNTIREREFRYEEQKGYYEYAALDTLVKKPDGYDFVVVNIGFDSSDYFEYRGHLSNENVVVYSSKTRKQIKR